MTLEELKVQDRKHGYRLVKIPEKITMLPCPICGKKQTSEWTACDQSSEKYFRRCDSCYFDGYFGKNTREAELAWNHAVETYSRSSNGM